MKIADVAVAHKHFSAIEYVVVAVADRARGHPQHMTARLGLRDRDRRQALTRGDRGQPGLLLFLAAEVDDLGDAELGGLHHGTHRTADPGQFLDDDRLAEVPHPHTAVCGGDGGSDPALPGDEPGQFVLDGAGRLHFGDPWPDLAFREVPDVFPELMVQSAAEVRVHP